MKPLIRSSALLLFWAVGVEARVGETKTEIEARYGNGDKSGNRVKAEGAESWTYKKAGFIIEVEIIDGKSVHEVLQGDGKFISDEDIKAVMKLYDSPSTTWRFDKKENRWKRSGKPKLEAYRYPGHPDFFVIRDAEVCDAAEKKRKAAENKEKSDPKKL